MPQMAPILWAPLFMFFLTLIYLLLSYIYFEYNKSTSSANINQSSSVNNWKW